MMKADNKKTSENQYMNNGIVISGKNNIKGDVVINIDSSANINDSSDNFIIDYDLSLLEEVCKESILNFSLTPWDRSYGVSYESVFTDNFFIDSFVKLGSKKARATITFSSAYKENKRCIILGEAGSGKSFLMKKHCVEELQNGKHALYLCPEDWNNNNDLSNYVRSVLSKRILPPDDLLIIIDGIDEIFATNHDKLKELIRETYSVRCRIWLGCRTNYYDNAICMEAIPYKRIYVQAWDKNQSIKYVRDYAALIGKDFVVDKYLELQKVNTGIDSFSKNPLRLSMLLYIIENYTGNNEFIYNEYALYKCFFELWTNNEIKRLKEIDLKNAFCQWQYVARRLYLGTDNSIKVSNNRVITSIFKSHPGDECFSYVSDFWHRSFMEYLLAKEAIEAMSLSPEAIIESLKFNNRSDVDYYIKQAFAITSQYQKNIISKNLIAAYSCVENVLSDKQEIFYVQNQVVYYLTRMNATNDDIPKFIRTIYYNPIHPILEQGIAYGAANIGLMDIALDFANKMKEPDSVQNRTNRAWTLIFYGDQPDEDPLSYEDTHLCSWKRSKEARLRRLKGNESKHHAFRMFDLCILHGFYESRKWKDLVESDFEIINETETDIQGYSAQVVDFLKSKKEDLVLCCKQHLESK